MPSRRAQVLVVLDAWEVRAVTITRSPERLRRLLLAERPTVTIATRKPAWLRRMPVPVETAPVPVATLALAGFPELRRLAGTRHERALRAAVTLADAALTRFAYDPHLPQDRPCSAHRPAARRPRARRSRRAPVRSGR